MKAHLTVLLACLIAFTNLGAEPLITRIDVPAELDGEAIFQPILGVSAIGENGHVLLSINDSSSKRGIYRWSNGILQLFRKIGQPTPGAPGETLTAFPSPGHIDRSGSIISFFIDTAGDRILGGGAGLVPGLLASNDSSPYRFIQRPLHSASGRAAFLASVPTPGNPGILQKWLVSTSPGGGGSALLKSGDDVPVAIDEEDPNKTIADINAITIGNGGRISCIITRNAFGNFGMILSQSGSSWTEVTRLFEPAPGTSDDFKNFNSLTAATGVIAFSATTSLGANGQTGIWRSIGGGAPSLIAIGEEPFGDTDGTAVTGGTLSTVRLPLVADSGACYFRASLALGGGVDATNNDLIMLHSAGLRTVVREGGLAPGLPAGENWRINQLPERFVISPKGQLAMVAEATSQGGTTHKWLWVSSTGGDLEPIFKVGDTIGGKSVLDIRMFTGFDNDTANPTGRSGADGFASPFNSRGELVIGVQHTSSIATYILNFSLVPASNAPFQIGSPGIAPDLIALPFVGKQGEMYQLERGTSPSSMSSIGEEIAGEDLRVFLSDTPPAGGGNFYYRIKRVAP